MGNPHPWFLSFLDPLHNFCIYGHSAGSREAIFLASRAWEALCVELFTTSPGGGGVPSGGVVFEGSAGGGGVEAEGGGVEIEACGGGVVSSFEVADSETVGAGLDTGLAFPGASGRASVLGGRDPAASPRAAAAYSSLGGARFETNCWAHGWDITD